MATGSVSPQRQRRSTRVRVQIPMRVSTLPPAAAFSEVTHTLMVNPRGCGVKLSAAVELQSWMRLEELPGGVSVNAQVMNCTPLGTSGNAFLVGLALETPGNVWGLESPPADWGEYAQRLVPIPPEEDPLKRKNWPYSLFSAKGEAHPGRR